MKKLMVGCVVAAAALVACGKTYTWSGATSSDFATGSNWSGGEAPTTADADINLVFPSGDRTVSGIGAMTVKTIVLEGGRTELQFGSAGGTFTVSGVISGAGGLTVTGSSAANCYFDLKGNNTFSGGYFGKGGRTYISNGNALGTGPAEFAANGKPGYPLDVIVACTVPNDITIGLESATIGTLTTTENVTFSGAFKFSNDAKYKISGNYNANYRIETKDKLITFTGPVTVTGGDFLPANGRVCFKNKVTSSNMFSYNGGGLIEFGASGNTVPTLNCNSWASGEAIFRISADNPFTGEPAYNVAAKNDLYGKKLFDLGGHDVTLSSLSADLGATTATWEPEVASATPATLTVHNTADCVYCGKFTGAASLKLNGSGKKLTVAKKASTTTGSLVVQAGTLEVTDSASFANVGGIEVADGATLTLSESAGEVATDFLTVGSTARLNLGGRKLTVKCLTLGGALQKKGSYTWADCAWLDEGSSVEVTLDTDVDGYVWIGTAGGEWNTPANWLKDGAVATTAPGADDTLYISAANAAYPFRVTSNTEISNPIVLGEGQQVFYVGTSGVYLALRGVVSGPGGIDFQSLDSKGYLRFGESNTFAGGVCRNGPGQIQLYNGGGLGTGPFTVKNPNGIVANAPMSFWANVTVTNDMTFLAEGQNNNGWNGAIGESTSEVHLKGKIWFTGDTRLAANGSSKLYFEGETVVDGRLTFNSQAHVYFATPVTSTTGKGYLHTDQGHGAWHFLSPSNALTKVYMSGGGSDAQVIFGATNALLESAFVEINASGTHTYVFDMGGFDQTLASFKEDTATGPATHYLTSATPATMTLKPADSQLTRVTLQGEASLDLLAAEGKTLTLSAGNHTTRGKLRASSGTLKLADGATAVTLSAIEVASGAKLVIDQTAGLFAGASLVLDEGAQLEVGAGRQLVVDYARVGGQALAAGTYSGVDWFSGAGSVKVVVSGGDGLYVWTGASGGEWNEPGNWEVNGAPAMTAPTADKTLYIGAANAAHPFRVTGAVEIANPIVLGAGQQLVQIGFGDGVLQLTGKITGTGGVRFDSIDNAQYFVALKNDTNDFVGGVRRSGAGQIQVYAGNALGVGLVTLDDGSVLNSGVANQTPFYVAQDCTIPNDFLIGSESYVSWNGWWGGKKGVTVHFTGAVEFAMPKANYNETRFAEASTIYFDGPVTLGGADPTTRLICKSGVTVWFSQKIKAGGGRRDIYADNGNATGYFCASSNELQRIYCGGVGAWKWYLRAVDALAGVELRLEGNPSSTGVLIDLGGFDQHVGDLYYAKPYNSLYAVSSDSPATLTVNAKESRLFGGHFDKAASLVYAPTGDFTYTLSNAVSTTTGSVTVARGTLSLKDGAKFAKAKGLEVRSGATVKADAADAFGRKADVRLSGTLNLAFEGVQRVGDLYLDGSDIPVETGLWGAEGNLSVPVSHRTARITGTGVLNVVGAHPGSVFLLR